MKKDRLLEDVLLLTHFLLSHAAHPNKALSPSTHGKCRKNLVSCASHEAVKFVISYHGLKKNKKFIKKVSGQIDDYLKGKEIDILPCLPDEERIRREIWFPRKKRARKTSVPNDLTARTLRSSKTGKEIKRFKGKKDLHTDLGL
jgi:hypothetical protein